MMPRHWKVLLDGFPEQEMGDVATRDGEVIGVWSIVDDVFYTFTPEGAEKFLFFEPFLGELCSRIIEWHENQDNGQG
jgi:hypothetical protein